MTTESAKKDTKVCDTTNEKVSCNVSVRDTVSGRLLNSAPYSSVTVKEVGRFTDSKAPNETSVKALNPRYPVFVGFIYTYDSNNVGGARVA